MKKPLRLNYWQALLKIQKCIETCETTKQSHVIEKMIDNTIYHYDKEETYLPDWTEQSIVTKYMLMDKSKYFVDFT